MEIGIHNGTLAIAIALSPLLLDNPTMAIPAAIYSLIMFFTAGLFGFVVSRRREQPALDGLVPTVPASASRL
jgi:BASS family bile acid:Na+ symporter